MDSSFALQRLSADSQQTLEDCDTDSETQDFQARAHLLFEKERQFHGDGVVLPLLLLCHQQSSLCLPCTTLCQV